MSEENIIQIDANEEALRKKRKMANIRNNLRALGVVGIALLVLLAIVIVCELYQYACLNWWAR